MRLIDADALKLQAIEMDLPFPPYNKQSHELIVFVYDINDAPTVDAVEVVSCKDCRYFMEYRERTETADGDCRCKIFDDADHLLCLPVHYDDFCSRGRKRCNVKMDGDAT